MPNIETKAVHVKITPSEAIECKRGTLELQLHLLNILKALISIKELRKVEFKFKTQARARMRDLSKEVNRILVTLPIGEELPKKLPKEKRRLNEVMPEKPVKGKVKIEEELREIKKQLEKLM